MFKKAIKIGGTIPNVDRTHVPTCAEDLKKAFKGCLDVDFFCANNNEEYSLFLCAGQNSYAAVGKKVNSDGNAEGLFYPIYDGNYTNLKMKSYDKVPIFHPKTTVLALKPLKDDNFEKVFTKAEVVSGPKKCKREIKSGPQTRRDVRHTYMLLFNGETEPRKVFEEFIVPTREFWGKELDEYGTKSESDSDSSSSSIESESDSSTSSSESESKKKHRKHSKHSKKESGKKHKKHHHHRSKEEPKIIIMPIFIPFPQYQNTLPFY